MKKIIDKDQLKLLDSIAVGILGVPTPSVLFRQQKYEICGCEAFIYDFFDEGKFYLSVNIHGFSTVYLIDAGFWADDCSSGDPIFFSTTDSLLACLRKMATPEETW